MTTTILQSKQFNIRVLFDQHGNPVICNAQGFYKIDSNCYDILPVSVSDLNIISNKLNIPLRNVRSSENEISQESYIPDFLNIFTDEEDKLEEMAD